MAGNSNRKKNIGPVIAMVIAILAITGFQGYWLKNNYDREKQNLDINTSASFRQTILRLQASKLKFDRFDFLLDSPRVSSVTVTPKRERHKLMPAGREPVITLLNVLQEKMKDTLHVADSFVKKGLLRVIKTPGYPVDLLKAGSRAIVRTLDFSRSDSLNLDPELIREIRVTQDQGSPERVIAVGVSKKLSDSLHGKQIEFHSSEDLLKSRPGGLSKNDVLGSAKASASSSNGVFHFLYNVDSLALVDSVTVKEVTDAFANRLKEDRINIPFTVKRIDSSSANLPGVVTIGFTKPASFSLALGNSFGYMLDKLKMPLLFSLLLIGITLAAFFLLYRNMIRQRRLAELKNDFISNITHELKTPIATVGVAIEALKNFNAIDDPQKTKEYLDISQNELQRLNLLVDKVLKLSIFEKKELELKKELFDCRQLVLEVMNSMKLQFDKYNARVSMDAEGDNFMIEADKLHITSVVYNLFDNALKYSSENPVIDVLLTSHTQHLELSITDNGIGIPAEYKGKVFDKFFRVPTGDRHNIKGYGLGLSYVAEVAKRHHGFITVESELGKGSVFTLCIPYKEGNRIRIDEHQVIKKIRIDED